MKNLRIGSYILILVVSALMLTAGSSFAGIPLNKVILNSTVFIRNEHRNVGTGFLMAKRLDDGRQGTFLITNKHILRQNGTGPYAKYIDVRFYKKGDSMGVEWVKIPILNKNGKFSEIVYMHPDEDVDIVGILVSGIINEISDRILFTKMTDDMILTRELAAKESIDAGEDLLVLGYTRGLFSESNYLPLVKSGLLASSMTEDLSVSVGGKVIRGKIYLVDGALFGGNSGGPVIVKPRWRFGRDSTGLNRMVEESLPLYILGIQSRSIQFTDKIDENINIKKDVMLNIVYSAEYINDIFDEYMKARESKK